MNQICIFRIKPFWSWHIILFIYYYIQFVNILLRTFTFYPQGISFSKFLQMTGTSLVVQWLRLHAPNAGNTGSSPSQGTKIQHVPWHSLKTISSNAFLEICYHRNADIKKCIRDYSFLFYFVENICRIRHSLISYLCIL